MTVTRFDEDTIECLLTPQDLAARSLVIDELSYSSPVLRTLTHDLLIYLQKKYDFHVDSDEPVSIEAIPMSDGCLAVIFSRNTYSEDIDPRYSVFSGSDETVEDDNDSPVTIEDALHRMLESVIRSDQGDNAYLMHRDSDGRESSTTIGIFAFESFEDILHLVTLLSPSLPMSAGIFRTENDTYLMIFHFYRTDETMIHNLLSVICEYGMIRRMSPGTEEYIREHAQTIMPVVPFIVLKTLTIRQA